MDIYIINNPNKILLKTIKRCFLKTPYFLFLKIENRKQFLVVKLVFLYFIFFVKNKKLFLSNKPLNF